MVGDDCGVLTRDDKGQIRRMQGKKAQRRTQRQEKKTKEEYLINIQEDLRAET